MNSFTSLGLRKELLEAIQKMGFSEPTEIQQEAIPQMLGSKQDLLALAQTGTGKTAAFGLPLLQLINADENYTQGLILSPTRELCNQIHKDLNDMSVNLPQIKTVPVYGGANISEQIKKLKRGVHIIVATPGRMKDLMRRKEIDISRLDFCILDEADEMLNMGFYEDLQDILAFTPKEKSTWLFSATMPKEVNKIAKKFMHEPYEITVGRKNEGSSQVSHDCYVVKGNQRYDALKRLVDLHPDIFSVVFCKTKRTTQSIAEKLISDGYNANALHGDLSQNQRDMVMGAFRNGQLQILVATDVAARGIDVDDITHVINYQLPDEIEIYTHRSGRTGRAGKTGVSIVLATPSEARRIKQIEKIIQKKFTQKELPSGDEICERQLLHLAEKMSVAEINPAINPYMDTIAHLFEDFSKEELLKKIFSVEFTKFVDYYKNSNNPGSQRLNDVSDGGDKVRFFMNIGKRDGFTWQSLKDLLKEELNLTSEDVFKVDVESSFSFFNVEGPHTEKVLKHFENFHFNGRKVAVEVSEQPEKRSGGRGRKGKGGGDRRRNDNKKGGDSRRGGDNRRKSKEGDRKWGSSKGGGKKPKRRSF